jgi:hypothetical protein
VVVVHVGKSGQQEHLMKCWVTKPIETQYTIESYSYFYHSQAP